MPIEKILQKPDLLGRLVSWAIELGEFDIEFHLRMAIKGQAVADFIAKFSNVPEEEEESLEKAWTTYVDGSLTRKYNGVGVILKGPNGEECEAAIQFQFNATNNEAQYKAMIARMNLARVMGVWNLEIKSDSQVMDWHVREEYEARGEKVRKYLEKVKEIMESFGKVIFTKIPREENLAANALVWIAFAIEEEAATSHRPVQEMAIPSIGRAN